MERKKWWKNIKKLRENILKLRKDLKVEELKISDCVNSNKPIQPDKKTLSKL